MHVENRQAREAAADVRSGENGAASTQSKNEDEASNLNLLKDVHPGQEE